MLTGWCFIDQNDDVKVAWYYSFWRNIEDPDYGYEIDVVTAEQFLVVASEYVCNAHLNEGFLDEQNIFVRIYMCHLVST